ncbi:hypothetical protein [Yinghuangia soli]|uniref:Secreted protein n=1 Tax=Yinghuangia soli TaxID=2908204 RepID=A0AA41PX87_9ACTN|nr:hypothetical protein [Yinghuangia soli]MCF2527242.1 hypothetical protein [Yinghuangia soli]
MIATCVAALAFTGASATVAQAQTSATAASWQCKGTQVSLCIEKVATDKVRVNFVNTTYSTVKARFGLTCAGPSGQWVYDLKTDLAPRGGYLSGTITCPVGMRDTAVGWQITSTSTYYSPRISI